MLFIFIAKKILGMNEEEALKLRGHYKAFANGFLSFPINLPGTAFHSSLQGRKSAIKMIKDVFKKRRSSKEKANEQDFVDYLLQEIENEETFITEEIAVDLIFFVIFAAHENTSSTMTLLFKYLTEYPDVLRQLKEEHENILRNREDKYAPTSWIEYKSMIFTHKVTNETLRLASIASGIFRKVLKDVEINGYTIPKGWTMVVCAQSVHLDANKYENPLEFNPSRWKDEELHSVSKTFVAFGGGNRMCVGANLSKVQISIFLHYLMTSYRWKVSNKGNITRQPNLNFDDGIRIQVQEIQRENNKEIITQVERV
ncbi:cytochrome P450 87A3-like [Lycium ferocissimum]|uniref:cytochrome P450 87A3-like n=1 Tax=Lycium ferocissimum TaxID=112874 RepID=UPI002815BC25|nr:cytochrome P450 87A3-like [Lycium ferocissimum]